MIGRVLRPHGIRGALLVEAISEAIKSLEEGSEIYLGDDNLLVKITSMCRHQKNFILSHSGASDRDQAESFRGVEVKLRFLDAEPLEDDEYYYWQILGIRVVTEDGRELGRIEDILETGANDVYVVRDQKDNEFLLPAIRSVIQEVDLVDGQMLVRLIPGLIQDKS